jgi:Holliday junction resolvase-like predicted endonuclease
MDIILDEKENEIYDLKEKLRLTEQRNEELQETINLLIGHVSAKKHLNCKFEEVVIEKTNKMDYTMSMEFMENQDRFKMCFEYILFDCGKTPLVKYKPGYFLYLSRHGFVSVMSYDTLSRTLFDLLDNKLNSTLRRFYKNCKEEFARDTIESQHRNFIKRRDVVLKEILKQIV